MAFAAWGVLELSRIRKIGYLAEGVGWNSRTGYFSMIAYVPVAGETELESEVVSGAMTAWLLETGFQGL